MSVAILLSARRRPRPRLALLLLTLLLIAASLVHLGLGARWIAPQTVLQALLEYDPRNFEQRIIIDLRLVRLAAALLTGAALGVAPDMSAPREIVEPRIYVAGKAPVQQAMIDVLEALGHEGAIAVPRELSARMGVTGAAEIGL